MDCGDVSTMSSFFIEKENATPNKKLTQLGSQKNTKKKQKKTKLAAVQYVLLLKKDVPNSYTLCLPPTT